jgi:hypothetical protein
MNSIYIHMETHNYQYGILPNFPLTKSDATQLPLSISLMIPCPSSDPAPRVPKVLLRHTSHNPDSMEAHIYNIVDNLSHYPITISTLEVLQTYPSQRK